MKFTSVTVQNKPNTMSLAFFYFDTEGNVRNPIFKSLYLSIGISVQSIVLFLVCPLKFAKCSGNAQVFGEIIKCSTEFLNSSTGNSTIWRSMFSKL